MTDPHDLFHSLDETDVAPIDTRKVISRARRRRLPAQVIVGGASTLAVVALVAGASVGLRAAAGSAGSPDVIKHEVALPAPSSSSSSPSSSTSSSAPVAGQSKRAPADRLNLCGGTVADVAPSASGLVLTPNFAAAAADAASGSTAAITGTVVLTNTGTETVTGISPASPAITLARGGVVLWHSNGPMIELAAEVKLAPGESMEYTATLVPVVCSVKDDEAESFSDNLPAAGGGRYEVSAAMDLSTEDDVDLITGPEESIILK